MLLLFALQQDYLMYLHCNTNQTNLPLEIASCLSTHKGSFLDGKSKKMMVENLGCPIEQVNLSSLSGLSINFEQQLVWKDKRKLKRRQLKKVLQKVLVRAEKYENYQETFDGHNSFSKTNPDAIFMRMKEEYIVVNSKQVMAVKRTS